MVSPAVLRPGPGKRRLRGDGGSVPGRAQATGSDEVAAAASLHLRSRSPSGAGAGRGRGLEGAGLSALAEGVRGAGAGACGPFQVVPSSPFAPQLANSKSDVPAVSSFPVPALSAVRKRRNLGQGFVLVPRSVG